MSLRIVACGGRNYRQNERIFSALDCIHRTIPIDLVIQGGDSGVDHAVRAWARKNKVRVTEQRRNSWALKMRPDAVVAFPGGKQTSDMVRRAHKAGVPVIEPEKEAA